MARGGDLILDLVAAEVEVGELLEPRAPCARPAVVDAHHQVALLGQHLMPEVAVAPPLVGDRL